MSDIVLKHGDIYAQIAQIPDKSVDLIIIDPPYDIPNNNIFHSKLLKDQPFANAINAKGELLKKGFDFELLKEFRLIQVSIIGAYQIHFRLI